MHNPGKPSRLDKGNPVGALPTAPEGESWAVATVPSHGRDHEIEQRGPSLTS
ncbi:hypothetical protein GHT06_014069 [Daphnia sinensis]|nr:hypothetical protein GHT06_013967 [Daphnia sinensis]KAI9559960.1 hypothetical protein GHT06_013968 [Daphnia sinensis]KAI9559961.1 hypothetical protein GHT06_013969 [Daphnia sinensis]KAI9560004.1 hypothetical protein GHT06_014012 [Daphnia sinensis]KAI9560005.1 hypothetical protein GHT06_014015 [Daphnia sinensis]